MSENPEPEGVEIPEHMAIANGHVYMIHVDVARQTPSDKEIATLLQRDREQALDAAGRHRLSELLLEKRNLASAGKVSDL